MSSTMVVTRVGEDIGVGEWRKGDWYVFDLSSPKGPNEWPAIGGPPVGSKEVAIQKALAMIDRGDYRAKGETPEAQMVRFRARLVAVQGPAETALRGIRDEVRKRLDNARTAGRKNARLAHRADTLEEVHALITKTMRDAGIPDYT